MQTKKYLITGLLGLTIVGIVAAFVMRGGNVGGPDIIRDGSLYSYVPGYADQLIYIDVDDDLLASLAQMDPEQYGGTFQQLVERVDTALVLQYATGDVVHNLLFLEGEEINIEELKALGLLADAENNQAKQLQEDLWLYGPTHSLVRQQTTSTTLQNNEVLYDYIQQVHAGNYNIGFLSNPLAGEQAPVMAQFTEKLLYTSVMTRLDMEGIVGTLQLQFADGIVAERSGSFAPVFADRVGEKTLAYIEVYDLLGLFGIEESQFMALAPVVLGQYGQAYGALLSQADYGRMYDALHGHIGIFLEAVPESMLGVGASVVFDSAELYDTLTIMSPAWIGLLEGMTGTGGVETRITPGGVVYVAHPGLLGGDAGLTLAALEKGDETTTLSVLGGATTVDKFGFYDPIASDMTSVVFRVDSAGLEQLGEYQPLVGTLDLPTGTQTFNQGVFQGNLETQADANRIIVNFSVLPSSS